MAKVSKQPDMITNEKGGKKYPRSGGTGENTPLPYKVGKRSRTMVTTLWYEILEKLVTHIYCLVYQHRLKLKSFSSESLV